MNDDIVHAVANFFGCDDDQAARWLESQSGAYTNIGGTQVWLDGKMIYQLLEAVCE